MSNLRCGLANTLASCLKEIFVDQYPINQKNCIVPRKGSIYPGPNHVSHFSHPQLGLKAAILTETGKVEERGHVCNTARIFKFFRLYLLGGKPRTTLSHLQLGLKVAILSEAGKVEERGHVCNTARTFRFFKGLPFRSAILH